MKLHSVNQVFETKDASVVNEKLSNGWKLLKVDAIGNSKASHFTYVLGWTHDETEEEYKRYMESIPF